MFRFQAIVDRSFGEGPTVVFAVLLAVGGDRVSLAAAAVLFAASAIRAVGADVIDRLLEMARAAAAAVWASVRPVVGVALAAVDVIAVVYVMRGAFPHRHLCVRKRRPFGRGPGSMGHRRSTAVPRRRIGDTLVVGTREGVDAVAELITG